MVIYLDCPLPDSSSGMSPNRNATYPRTRRATVQPSVWSCFEWGLHSIPRYRETGGLLHRHSTLTLNQRFKAVSFLLHFPGSHLHRTLSGTLPYEARTFLCTNKIQRPSVLLVIYHTGKTDPPTNSRTIELCGIPSLEIPRKYLRNLRSLLASWYSGSSSLIPKSNGSTYCLRTAIS